MVSDHCLPYWVLVLSVIITFVSVGPQHEPGNPRRCPAHLFADVLDAGVFFCLQNDFVVDMPDDSLLPKRLHGMCQNVAADSLCDVFHQLRAVGLDPLVFLLRRHAIVELTNSINKNNGTR